MCQVTKSKQQVTLFCNRKKDFLISMCGICRSHADTLNYTNTFGLLGVSCE